MREECEEKKLTAFETTPVLAREVTLHAERTNMAPTAFFAIGALLFC